MSLKINAIGMNDNLAGNLNKHAQRLGRSLYTLPALVPQFKDGGPVTPKGAMQFKGPGTGKSDSIEAKLPVQGFVLPVEVVQSIGADKLQAMISLFDQESAAEDQAEGQEEVTAKVSNGEVWVPPEVVEKTGAEYWDSLIASVNGQGAQPEMGEHGEMMAAGGGLMDERMAAQQFWQNAPSTPVPVPGRANPPNPAELMKDRLETSGGNLAQQAPSLRERMLQQTQGPSLAQAATPVQRQVTTPIPAYTTPTPNPNPLKNANALSGGEAALATGLAYDVLNSPQNVEQVNGAIAGLKERAGFNPASTPYPGLKNYAKGGEVKGYLKGGEIYSDEDKKKLTTAGQNFTQAVGGAVKPLVSGSTDYQAARKEGYGVIPATLKTGSEQLSRTAAPVIDTAASGIKQGYDFLLGTPPSLKQAVTPPVAPVQTPVQTPQTQQQSVQAPQVQGALPPAIGKSANWNETGYRTDDAPQTLGWNESRWSNSGDPVQDAALAERQGNLASLRQQANVMQQNPEIAGALNPAAAILPQSLQETKRQNDLTNTLERDKMAQPAPPKYGSSDGQVYQQEGAGAQDFNQNVKKKFTPAFNTEDLSYLPQDATDNDILGFKTMPKYVWEGFADDVAKSGSPQEQESKVAEMARRSGIGIAALKALLYPR